MRRSPHVVGYWGDGRLIVENYRSGIRVAAAPLTVAVLDACSDWLDVTAVAGRFPAYDPASVKRAVRQLLDATLLEVFDRRRRPPGADLWASWHPAAGLLHFSSKDLPYRDATASRRLAVDRAGREPMPAPLKRYPRARRIALPLPKLDGEFPRVLLDRRTWRRFAPEAVPLDAVATLLALSCAIRYWVPIPGIGMLPLKTYPSGGAQHPLEVYVAARRVKGLAPGLYHYAPDAHRLERVRHGLTARDIARYVPRQEWYGRAAALLLITAAFPRTQWKYRFSRAYKAVIAEAGHLCQNICLTATWLGLAPFCTMALGDSAIERDLGVDGVAEAIVYAAGVGARPRGVDWAPRPVPHRTKRIPGPLAGY